MTPPDPFQAEVARLALAVTRDHGFALAGGHALIAHGIIERPTEDVDLFTDEKGGVPAAGELVVAALTAAGLVVQEVPETTELGDVFYGFENDMIEYVVSRGQEVMRLQLVCFDRARGPVLMDIGPVLHLDDVIGTKVAALATRAYPRDFVDVGAALARYTRAELRDLALRADPALTDEEFADAMRRFDRLDDDVLYDQYGLSGEQVAEIRSRFADWPRH
jgi:hypothetical protein